MMIRSETMMDYSITATQPARRRRVKARRRLGWVFAGVLAVLVLWLGAG
jgi:hypothetical protein